MRVLMSTLAMSAALVGAGPALSAGGRPSPSLFSLTPTPDLGTLDVASPIRGSIYVMNNGAMPLRVLPPFASAVSRLRVLYPKALEIAPNKSIEIPWEYDGHGDLGMSTFKIELRTNDPGARTISETITYRATETTRVRPFRSSVTAVQTDEGLVGPGLEWEFFGGPGAEFVAIEIEDPKAPLRGSFVRTPGGGLLGTVAIDANRLALPGAQPVGETRFYGVTSQGNKDYFWLQWRVQKGSEGASAPSLVDPRPSNPRGR